MARNYVPFARVLARSFLEHHPEARVDVLVVDAPAGWTSGEDDPFSVITPMDLGIGLAELRMLATIYDVTELSTALKPWLLEALLGRRSGPVVFLDPDIEVFASIRDVDPLAARHHLVLTPHTNGPMPTDDRHPSDYDLLLAGSYNLGFIAVGPDASGFLRWWKDRLRFHCLSAPELGMFVDQRWVELATRWFPHFVLDDPGCNVAHWNIHERSLSGQAGAYRVNDAPLRFFHFSGFDPSEPTDLTTRRRPPDARPMVLNQTLQDLLTGYAAKVLKEGYDELAQIPYGYATSVDGAPLTKPIRRAYRAAHLEMPGRPLPDPFDPAHIGAFSRWRKANRRRFAGDRDVQVELGFPMSTVRQSNLALAIESAPSPLVTAMRALRRLVRRVPGRQSTP